MKNKLLNSNAFLSQSYEHALSFLQNPNMKVPDLLQFLRQLEEHSELQLKSLINFIELSPFFLEGKQHSKIRGFSQKVFDQKRIQEWQSYRFEQYNNVITYIQTQQQFDLVEVINELVFDKVITPFLSIKSNNFQLFKSKAIPLQGLIEPLRSIKELSKINEELELLQNISEINEVSPRKLTSAFDLYKQEKTFENLSESDFKTILIILFAATAPLAQTVTNAVVNVFQREHPLPTPEDYLENIDTYIWQASAPVFIHRIATERVQFKDGFIEQGRTVLIDILESHKKLPNKNEYNNPLPPVKGLHFGFGKHFCIGAYYSKIMITEFLPLLIKTCPQLKIISKVRDESNHIARAYKSVEMTQTT